jgi:hypothetical protein
MNCGRCLVIFLPKKNTLRVISHVWTGPCEREDKRILFPSVEPHRVALLKFNGSFAADCFYMMIVEKQLAKRIGFKFLYD